MPSFDDLGTDISNRNKTVPVSQGQDVEPRDETKRDETLMKN